MKKEIIKLSEDLIEKELLTEAKIVGINNEALKEIIKIVTEKMMEWGERRSTITREDFNTQIAKILTPYNEELAYLFTMKNKLF